MQDRVNHLTADGPAMREFLTGVNYRESRCYSATHSALSSPALRSPSSAATVAFSRSSRPRAAPATQPHAPDLVVSLSALSLSALAFTVAARASCRKRAVGLAACDGCRAFAGPRGVRHRSDVLADAAAARPLGWLRALPRESLASARPQSRGSRRRSRCPPDIARGEPAPVGRSPDA